MLFVAMMNLICLIKKQQQKILGYLNINKDGNARGFPTINSHCFKSKQQ